MMFGFDNRIMPEMAARTSLKSHARANKSSTKLEFCKRLNGDFNTAE